MNITSSKRSKSASGSGLIAFVSLSLGFSSCLFGASIWNIWASYQAFDRAIAKQVRLQTLSHQIVYFDEVLTMSARMAASTGDLKWEERYNRFVSQLDSTIDRVIQQAPDTYNANAKQTNEANLKLVDLETKSFQLVRQGKAPQALKILSGSEYESLKQVYSKGISATLNAIQLEIESSVSRYRQSLFRSLLLAGLSSPVLLVTGSIFIHRIRGYVRERERVQLALQELNQELEFRVEERSQELKSAHLEVTRLNEQLKSENSRMGAELNILKQMQQMILPKPEELEIEGLDIAGFMEPADEVGGDYYDVLQAHGVVTIGMGDVTGHGLESGILMLMTQTAVRTLQEVREPNPIRFLSILNSTIYKNIKRMNSDKNLTFVVLNYAEGKVSISGQHEETIVVRNGGYIERIDTMDLGLPIGLDDDIADFISHRIVELYPGDGIVLYTDGIPEAQNLDKKQYGIEPLCATIGQNWHKSASEIKEAIIADVKQFIGKQKVFDDITLLVLKLQDDVVEDIQTELRSRSIDYHKKNSL
jgi:serine phosphatase RsbU (regulator of sigma subunit)